MSQDGGNVVPRIARSEHIGSGDTGDNIEAKRVANYVVGDDGQTWQRQASGLTDTELRATPIEVNAGNKDIFGYQIIVQPYNQIELRGDDSDWASFVTETNANGGDTAQASGLLSLTTSTATNGSAILSSVDTVKYRPGVGVYGAGTMIFTTGVTGSNQYFGLGSSTAFANGVQFGYKGTSFGIRYMRGGVEQSFIAQADWDDPCLGAATSNFTRAGTPEALDPTKNNLYRFEAGLFGFAGWRAQVWSPDNGWITVYIHEHINTDTTPVFESNTFYMVASNVKTSGATNITMKTQCWAAGTGTPLMRLATTLTDRTLAQTSRAVLAAKLPNGTYSNIDATAGGNLKVSLEEVDGAVTIPISNTHLSNQTGTWGYNAGTSGTLVLSGGKRVLQITAIALGSAGSISINGGDSISIPYDATDKASSAITLEPKGNLTNPTIIFTGTDGYVVEYTT